MPVDEMVPQLPEVEAAFLTSVANEHGVLRRLMSRQPQVHRSEVAQQIGGQPEALTAQVADAARRKSGCVRRRLICLPKASRCRPSEVLTETVLPQASYTLRRRRTVIAEPSNVALADQPSRGDGDGVPVQLMRPELCPQATGPLAREAEPAVVAGSLHRLGWVQLLFSSVQPRLTELEFSKSQANR